MAPISVYAPFSDFAGVKEAALVLDDETTVAQVVRRLAAAYPALGPHLAEDRPSDEAVLLIVNGRLASPGDPVRPGDEVFLIPQITGG